RDGHVTGVQTCALPICLAAPETWRCSAATTGRWSAIEHYAARDRIDHATLGRSHLYRADERVQSSSTRSGPGSRLEHQARSSSRSEERRVGKECRSEGG